MITDNVQIEIPTLEPKLLSILGTDYVIKHVILGNDGADGYCDYTSKEILIRDDNYNKVGDFEWLQKKQLRHEIIHAFMAESGLQSNWQHLNEFGQDETTVDWFAIQFPKILKAFQETNAI